MLCVPTVSALVTHSALRMLPAPESAIALQPPIEAAPSRKLTLPVGALPLTVAVNVTLEPEVDGVPEVVRVVVVTPAPGLTTCDNTALDEPRLLASPP